MEKLLASQSQAKSKSNMINSNGQPSNSISKTTKVTIAADHFYDYVQGQGGYHDYNGAISIWILHVGSHTIEVATSQYDYLANQWAAKTLRDLRYLWRRGTSPQVVISLCAFKGTPIMPTHFWARNNNNRRRIIDPNQCNPYRAISICLGGSHVLFHRQDYDYWWDPEFPVTPLKKLLRDNKKVVVIGLGIKDIAKKLKDHWQLEIAQTVELRKLVAWSMKHEILEDLELEAMAELVLDGMRVEKKPARVLQADWGISEQGYAFESELVKYASRDAFLSYQIATNCIRKAGGLPSHILDDLPCNQLHSQGRGIALTHP